MFSEGVLGRGSQKGFLEGVLGRSLPNHNKISDNKIRKISKFYCHGISKEKQRFGTIFRKISPPRPPPKRKFY